MEGKQILVKLLEAQDKEGSLWKVSVLSEGPSKNDYKGFPIYYPKETLAKVAKRIEGTPAYIYQLGDAAFDHFPEEYRDNQGSFLANLIGWYRRPRLEEIDGKTHLVADLYIHRGAQAVRKFLKDAWEAGKRLGVSIVADGLASFKRHGGRMYAWMEDLFFASADPVSHPATGARILSLLESERKKGGPMSDAVSRYLLELAGKLAPDLIADVQEAEQELSKDEAIALVTNLIETLNPDSFPEANLKERLNRLRETIEEEDFDSAAEQLSSILLKEEESEEQTEEQPSSEEVQRPVVEQGDQSPEEGVPKDDMEKLEAHFGEETASRLVELLGDAAVDCLPERSSEVRAKEQNILWEKLKSLLELVEKGEKESAVKLLTAILAGKYPSPYPYPKPTYGKPYPKPAAAAPAEESGQEGVSEGQYAMEDNEKEDVMEEVRQVDPDEQGIARLAEVERRLAVRETQEMLQTLLQEMDDPLPKPVQERLMQAFSQREATEDELREAIEAEREYARSLVEHREEKHPKSPIEERLEELSQRLTQLEEERKQTELREAVRAQVQEVGLPSPAEQRLMKRLFEGTPKEELTPEKISEAVDQEAKFVDELISTVASQVTGFGEGETLTAQESQQVLEGFFAEAFDLVDEKEGN